MTEKSVVDIPIGSVVLANAGRDKGRYFVAVAASGGFVYIADGKDPNRVTADQNLLDGEVF